MPVTEFVQLAVANALFRGISTVFVHTNAYVGLFTSDPGYLGDQSNEVTGGSYARVQPSWSRLTDAGICDDISFVEATASWGTVTYVAMLDSASGGNMLAYEVLPTPRTLDSGDEVFLPGSSFDFFGALTFSGGGSGLNTRRWTTPYRRDRFLEVIINGGTLAAEPGSWVGLASGTTLSSGVGSDLNDEPDTAVAPDYQRFKVNWTISSTNPVTLTNTNLIEWTVLSGSQPLGWENASRTVVLLQDPVAVNNQDGAPASIAWTEWHTEHGTSGVTGLDVLRLPVGSMTIVM